MDNEPVDQVEDSQSIQAEAPDTAPSGAESAPPLGGGAYQQQAAPNQSQSPWDAFKRLPEFQGADDRAIAARLYNAMEREKAASHALAQYQQVLPYAQEWLSNRREIEEYRQWKNQQQASPQAMQQAKQPEAEKWWNPPKVRDAYKRYLAKDEEGRDVISPDAPLDAKHELMEYMQYRADFAKNFLDDPQKALGPMIAEMASKQAEEIIQDKFQRAEQEQFVTTVEEENRDWLFDPQTGNVTPEGLLIHKYIEQAREHGIKGPQARWDYAVAMTERDLLAKRYDQQQAPPQQPTQPDNQHLESLQRAAQEFMAQQAAPPQPAAPAPKQPDIAQQNMQYLRREASRNPSRSAGAANPDPRAPKPKLTFEQMLREDASSRGLI
jgi:hypothetical protein